MTLSVVSGTCALVALIGGSPLEFGVALAFCAGWLMAADFIESAVERERERAARTQMHDAPADEAGQRRPLPSAELQRLF